MNSIMQLTCLIPEVVGSSISEEKKFVSACGTCRLIPNSLNFNLELSSNII